MFLYEQEEKDWLLFKNKFKDFENTKLPKLKETLSKEMFNIFNKHMDWIMNDNKKYNYYNECYNLFKEWLERSVILLENTTKKYFESIFDNIKKISFFNKKAGNQLGIICEIQFNDNSIKKYYIKTHQFGPTNSLSKSRKRPDVKELIIYKILENLNFGPKCYFFEPDNVSKKSLYIATEGLNLKYFYSDNIFILNKEEKRELLKLDLISRIFNIYDSTTNPGNFGYDEKNNKAYIIDFGIDEQISYYTKNIINEFYSGNKKYNYSGYMKEVVSIENTDKNLIIKEFIENLNLKQNILNSKIFLLNLMKTNENINSKEILEKYINEILMTVEDINNFFT